MENDIQKQRKKLLDQALEGFSQVWKDGPAFMKLLDICERFSRQPDALGGGPVNAMLLYRQAPDATWLVSNEQRTRQKLYAKAGAQALHILPKPDEFAPIRAFDVSQLQNPPPDIPAEPPRRAWRDMVEAIGNGESQDTYYTMVSAAVPEELGMALLPAGEGRPARILFNGEISKPKFIACALTGFSQYLLYAERGEALAKKPDFLARASGYMVCRRWGLDPSGFAFPPDCFPEDVDTPGAVKEIVSRIILTGGSVYGRLEKKLASKEGPRLPV